MADALFQFRLVTPQRLLVAGEIVSLKAPGSEGYLGVLAHHAPLITSLRPGRLDVRDAGGEHRSYAVSGGFLEVSGNRATVLAETAERSDEIDRTRSEKSLRRAEERLRGGTGGDKPGARGEAAPIDRDRAQRSVERAKNRLNVVQR